MSALYEHLLTEIGSNGPMPFDEFVELALYDSEHGFYAAHGRAGGRRGDFLTSVEVGPLFGAVVADWLDEQWRAAGRPDEFRVAEVGAGVGTLFRAVNRAQPDCFGALVYTLVERSAIMRTEHAELPTPRWRSQDALPGERQHVIVANELLDNLGFAIAERVDDGWAEVRVVCSGSRLALTPGSVSTELDGLSTLAPDARPGRRVPVARQASQWVAAAIANAERVLLFDYAAPTAELAERGQSGWLRTYAGHVRGHDPLESPGEHDITHDVPFDQLPSPDRCETQAEWLRRNGIDDRVATARRTWNERAHIGDLAAIAARSAIGEAEALTADDGLGAFTVLQWG